MFSFSVPKDYIHHVSWEEGKDYRDECGNLRAECDMLEAAWIDRGNIEFYADESHRWNPKMPTNTETRIEWKYDTDLQEYQVIIKMPDPIGGKLGLYAQSSMKGLLTSAIDKAVGEMAEALAKEYVQQHHDEIISKINPDRMIKEVEKVMAEKTAGILTDEDTYNP